MTVEKLNELISSVEAKIEKKLSTINKKKKQIEKKEDLLVAKGFLSKDYQKIFEADHDLYWKVYDIKYLKEDIDRHEKEIAELRKKIDSYKEALVDVKKDLDLVMKRPSILDDLEEDLYREFYNNDSEYTDHLKNALRRLGYKDFRRMYKGQYSLTIRTDDDSDLPYD